MKEELCLNDVYKIDIGSTKPCLERFKANVRHWDQTVSLRPKYWIGVWIDWWINFSNKFVDIGEGISDQLILKKKNQRNQYRMINFSKFTR